MGVSLHESNIMMGSTMVEESTAEWPSGVTITVRRVSANSFPHRRSPRKSKNMAAATAAVACASKATIKSCVHRPT